MRLTLQGLTIEERDCNLISEANMSISYTRNELLSKCNEAIKDVETFYTEGFVNYQGKIKLQYHCTTAIFQLIS